MDKAGGVDPGILDTLALAQHRTGNTAKAIETEKRAISLIPEGADESTRKELETNLRTFQAALAETDKPPADGGQP